MQDCRDVMGISLHPELCHVADDVADDVVAVADDVADSAAADVGEDVDHAAFSL